MSAAALALFERFSHQDTGYAAILEYANGKERETTMVDFKCLRQDGQLIENGKFPPALRAILSVNTSAFSNERGGVLIWGVNCPNGKKASTEPVPRASELCEHMKALSLDIVDPQVSIDHRAVVDADGIGFVVTYISEATKKPVMSTFQNDRRYYIRTGDNCEAMSNTLVQALMTSHSSPELELIIGPQEVTRVNEYPDYVMPPALPTYTISTHFKLYNHGPAIARDCAVVLHLLKEGSEFRPQGGIQSRQLELPSGESVETSSVYTFADGFKIHPGTGMFFGQLNISTNARFMPAVIGVELVAERFHSKSELSVPLDTENGRANAEEAALRRTSSPPRTGRTFV